MGGFQVGGHRGGLYEFGVCLNGEGQLPACERSILDGHREPIEVRRHPPFISVLFSASLNS